MSPRANLRVALLAALAGFACLLLFGDPIDEPPVGPRPLGPRTWTADPEWPGLERQARDLAAAIRARERHDPDLLRIAGVHATAVGWTGGGRAAIHVYVEEAVLREAEAERARAARLGTGPPRRFPRALDGIPVVLRPGGPFYALQEAGPREPSVREDGRAVDRQGRFERPVPIGVSTGHPASTAGTIGALVTDGSTMYALSNYHVFVAGDRARLGDRLLQPGPADGGVDPGDAIGTLAAFEPIALSPFASNRIDAALARTTQVDSRTPTDGYGAPRARTATARPGMAVKKYGRTTGLTFGGVEAIHATVTVRYRSGGVARFTGQVILCCSLSAGGDSGSLIVLHDVDEEGNGGPEDRRPVGLLFAGDGSLTIANPIDEVLEAFGVRIVGGGTP